MQPVEIGNAEPGCFFVADEMKADGSVRRERWLFFKGESFVGRYADEPPMDDEGRPLNDEELPVKAKSK